MSANGISTLSTKQAKQEAKLALAATDRAATGRRPNLVIGQLPTQYSGNNVVDNPNVGGLIEGRPWTSAPAYSFVTSGAMLYLDAGNAASYSGSGTTWTDLSANTNDATLVGSPAFTNVGTSSYFTFPNDGAKYATTPYTKYSGTYTGKSTFFVARIDASMANGYHAIFGSTPARTFNTYIYKNGANSQIHASFGSGGGLSSSFALATNQWFTFGITQNSNTISYYLNGQAVGVTTSQPLGTTYSSNTDPQWIGKGDNFWHGDIAVATVYDRALSGAEMTENHNAIVGRYGL
jgi:hypothetical protein